MKRWVGNLPADHKLPEKVMEVLEFEAAVKQTPPKGKGDESEIKMARQVVGKNGFIVVLEKDKMPAGAILVRIKDGQAKVVGLPQ